MKDKAKQKRVAEAEKKRWEAAAQAELFEQETASTRGSVLIPRCNRCHRPLKDPGSISRGLGTGCYRKLHPVQPREVKAKRGRKLRARKKYKPRKDWRQMNLPLVGEDADNENMDIA